MFIYRVEKGSILFTAKRVREAVDAGATELGLGKGLEQHSATRSHWHLITSGKSGTLEVTFDVKANQLLVIVHDNRIGSDGWAKKQAPRFARTLAKRFKGQVQVAPQWR